VILNYGKYIIGVILKKWTREREKWYNENMKKTGRGVHQ